MLNMLARPIHAVWAKKLVIIGTKDNDVAAVLETSELVGAVFITKSQLVVCLALKLEVGKKRVKFIHATT